MGRYRCYFITAANKAEESFLIEASSPQVAADEALMRCANPTFVSMEVWDGTACALTRRLGQRSMPSTLRPPPAHHGDA